MFKTPAKKKREALLDKVLAPLSTADQEAIRKAFISGISRDDLIMLAQEAGLVRASTNLTGGIELIGPTGTITDPRPIEFFGRKDADTAFTGLVIAPWVVNAPCDLTAVRGFVGTTQAGSKMEVVIYSERMTKVASTGEVEIPIAGIFELAVPKTRLPAGNYWCGIMTNATTATFGTVSNVKGFLRTNLLPPSLGSISVLSPTRTVPAIEPICGDLPAVNSLGVLVDSSYQVIGGDGTVGVWATNANNNKLAKSTDGIAFVDLMDLPSMPFGYAIDLLIHGGKAYILNSRMKIFVSSDLTASATWTDISCPVSAGLLHSVAQARPYNICIWQDYLWLGEYTTSDTGETINDPTDPSGPRILKYGPLSGTPSWSLGYQFTGVRHVHGLLSGVSTIMFAIVGDNNINGQIYGDGTGLGYWRVTNSNIANFVKWNANNGLYSVDAVYLSGFSTSAELPDGLYGSSDQAGCHIQFCKLSGNAGQFVTSRQCFTPTGRGAETARGLVVEGSTKNIYYHTTETDTPAIFVTPPPGIRPYKLYDLPVIRLDARAVVAYNRVFHYNYHHPVVRFPWQTGV